MTAVARQRTDWDRDERYRQLVELAPDAILIHDGGQIVLANAAAVRLAGALHRTQLLGQPIETFLDPPYLKGVQAHLTDAASPAELVPPVRDTFRRLDGYTVEVEVRAVAFMDHGRPSAHLVIRDITERLVVEQTAREVQDRLHQVERMEAVGALAGGVAHEVNNMMQVILGCSGFLLQDEGLGEERLGDVRQIAQAADRAAAVTRQLLAFSRRAAHRPQIVNLGSAVRAAEPAVRRLLGEGRRLVIAADAAPQVWVDPGQLQQVVVNLVQNAREAMPTGGTLTLMTVETELPSGTAAADGVAIPPGRYAALVVRDTGAGMDAAIQAKMFEPFFTTKPLGEGTGLGLAAAHGILSQNNGYITVTSAPGEGSTFTVYLPLKHVAETVEPRPAPARVRAEPVPTTATVLVVDDEPAVRSMSARILRRGGFHVVEAATGAEALALVGLEGPPRLVLTDLMMPGMGGVELARRLKERWPALPVVFMSGYWAEELTRQGLLGGGADRDLIQKPFTPDALVARVAAAISRSEVGPPPPKRRSREAGQCRDALLS